MKKALRNIRYKFFFLCFCILCGIYAYAGDNTDTLSASDYHYHVPKHFDSFYTGAWPYIIFGVLLVVMSFGAYHYWSDARAGKDIWHDPTS